MTQKVIPQWVALVGVVVCLLFIAVVTVWIVGWWRAAALAGIYVVWGVSAYTLTIVMNRRREKS